MSDLVTTKNYIKGLKQNRNSNLFVNFIDGYRKRHITSGQRDFTDLDNRFCVGFQVDFNFVSGITASGKLDILSKNDSYVV
ncbi:MAG TPA: hypothetical protein ENI51_02100 [Candidatus Atribacteria bacterium]|nr:hypothetical protein [Candidatus Atribacteria bacterium]